MLEWLKWIIAGREMMELERRRLLAAQYLRWLAEFEDVSTVLANIEAEAAGVPVSGWPLAEKGPWTVQGLREVLRQRVKAPPLRLG